MERKTMTQNEDSQIMTMYLSLKVSANTGTVKAYNTNSKDFLKQRILDQMSSPTID